MIDNALSWSDFRAEYLGFYTPPLYPRATYFSVRRVLDVCEECGVKSLADLRPKLVSSFCSRTHGKDGKPIAVATVATQLSYLRTLCGYAVTQGYISVDPTKARKTWISDTEAEFDKQHLCRTEALAVYRQAEAEAATGSWKAGRLEFLVKLIALLGLRKSEALGLHAADINLEDRTVLIRKHVRRRIKTGKKAEAYLPMPDELVRAAERWLPRCGGKWAIPACDVEKPWLSGGPSSRPLEQLRGLGLRSGVPGVNFLIWRHTWATHAESLWGLSDGQIQRILRHTRPMTAKQYYRHADLANLRAPMASIDFEQPRPALRQGAQA